MRPSKEDTLVLRAHRALTSVVRFLFPDARIPEAPTTLTRFPGDLAISDSSFFLSADRRSITVSVGRARKASFESDTLLCYELPAPATDTDVRLLRIGTRLAVSDVQMIGSSAGGSEVFDALVPTIPHRIIARSTPFSTRSVLHFLECIDLAASMSDEGSTFGGTLLFYRSKVPASQPFGEAFFPFPQEIPLRHALLNDTWLRATLKHRSVASLSCGRPGAVHGLVSLPASPDADHLGPFFSDFPAHKFLLKRRQHASEKAQPAMLALHVAPSGVLYLLESTGLVFQRVHGRWTYVNIQRIRRELESLLPKEIAFSLLQLALDQSYRRRGSLLVAVPKEAASRLVRDRRHKDKPNKQLRGSISSLNFLFPPHRDILSALAGVDGACLISDKSGLVLDVGALICDPSPERLRELGIAAPRRFSGARTTAAWNASLEGVAVKISDDGPISVWSAGNVVCAVGA